MISSVTDVLWRERGIMSSISASKQWNCHVLRDEHPVKLTMLILLKRIGINQRATMSTLRVERVHDSASHRASEVF